MRKSAIAALLVAALASLAYSEVTLRIGEQDTCSITGVTTVSADAKGGQGQIKFDLAKLPQGGKCAKAVLRMWVNLGSPAGKPFAMSRWSEPEFDGFKVWQVGGKNEPLATAFPFTHVPVACFEWDVTSAVADWLAKPDSNQGLKTNFPLAGTASEPAWQRPYLQLTLAETPGTGTHPGAPGLVPVPKQPTELKAWYRAGQVFLTWKQTPHTGAFFDSTYRVYMADQPITAANVGKASLLGEVNRLSQLNYRRTTYSRDGRGSYAGYGHLDAYLGVEKTKDMTEAAYKQALLDKIPVRYNFVIDDSWMNKIEAGKWLADANVLGPGLRELKGPELPDDAGLFVYTVAKPGKAFLAVTSVIEGNENKEDFAAGNAFFEKAGAIDMKVEPIRPVLQVVFNRIDKGYPNQKSQIREYAYWGGPELGLSVEPSTPFYFRANPPREFIKLAGKGATPPWIAVEGWWSHGGTPIVPDVVYLPPTRLAPFVPTRVAFTSGGWKESAKYYYGAKAGPDGAVYNSGDIGRGNYYGHFESANTGKDPRQGKVLPYLENRILREVELFFQEFPQADRNYVVMTGETNGMMTAIHHPEVFANCSAAQEVLWSAPARGGEWSLVGARDWKLVNDQGFSPWDWNDPVWYAKQFPTRTWPFISHCMSPNYARSDQTHWGNCGYPQFYLEMVKDRRGGQWWWCDIGDAPNGGSMAVPKNQAYLAFTNVNFCETPQVEWKQEPRGTLNGYLTWHHPEMPFSKKPAAAKPAPKPASGPAAGAGKTPGTGTTFAKDAKVEPVPTDVPLDLIDTPERFEVAIRIGDRGLSLNGQSVPPTGARFGATDITPWRFQQFKVNKGGKYVWQNVKLATGQLLQAGSVEPDERGLLTIVGFFVDRDPLGNKLILESAGGKAPPKVDESIKVGELTLAEYAQRCRNPVVAAPVTAAGARLTIDQFVYSHADNPDGSFSYKGGSFSSNLDTVVEIADPGWYVLAVKAKGEFGATWPLMGLQVGGTYGTGMGMRVVDTPDWQSYRWYAQLDKGKLPMRILLGGDYYATPMLPDLAKKRLHVAELSFQKIAEADLHKPAEIRIAPRAVSVPANMPIRMTATVLNGKGLPVQAPVNWSCQGGTITPEGKFIGDKPGGPRALTDCIITAKAGGLTATAPITVGQAFTADFNEGSGVLRFWTALDGDKPGKWSPPAAGHTFLSSLHQWTTPANSALIWDGGMFWTDSDITAEVFMSPTRREPFSIGKGKTVVHGLVIRAADKDNLYRLEVRRTDESSTARLVKRVAGKEVELAKSDSVPPLAPFDWKTNPICPGWKDMGQVQANERGISQWRVDRLRLAAKGNALSAWINGKEIFAGVKDGDLKAGSAGLYAENQTVFDNVEVRQP